MNYDGQWLATISYFGIKLTYALCVYVCMWVAVLFEHVYNRDIVGYDSAGVHEQRRSQGVPHLTKTKVSSTNNILIQSVKSTSHDIMKPPTVYIYEDLGLLL